MTETEFDIVDELYFVTSFAGLQQQLGMGEAELRDHLQQLILQGYVKCFFPDPDTEIAYEEAAFAAQYRSYFYLATKKGLIAHNSR